MDTELSPRARIVGVVAWCSFLAACGAAAVVFALLDPASLWFGDRRTAYAVGFFFFWLVAACSAALALYTSRTGQ